jgi:hypothetical protein
MKNMFKYGVMLVALVTMAGCGAQRIADKETHEFRYELEAAGVGEQGTYQVKVWTYSRNPRVALEQAKKNAVHGVIFKGFAGKDRRVPGQRPLATDASGERDRADYFEPFCATGGRYQQFVSLVNNGAIAPGDRFRVGKEYKVGVVVSVSVSELRKELENAGIIKKLGSIF